MMRRVVIENPVINSAFSEPQCHFKFDEGGITDEIVPQRRKSEYFIPIPKPKRSQQIKFDFGEGWTGDRLEENRFINDVRKRVALWRQRGYQGITPVTRRLLTYWKDPEREKKFFFCQIEAIETAIYIMEVADKYGDSWIRNELRRANEMANPLLFRIAFKMATGTGKTVVMAMLMAWHTLNKLANRNDRKFSDAFLIVTPGVTIRDRLRVLLPNDPGNYYDQRDILPPDDRNELGKAKIVITNFHAFLQRTKTPASKITNAVLQNDPKAFTETLGQMVRRVLQELGGKRNIVVLNDEAHPCYRHKQHEEAVKLDSDERKEVEKRNEDARVWISGIEEVKKKTGIKVVYDLSATPFFLKGSGYSRITSNGMKVTEGVLFPWVVSDFSLIDAIESGIVKVPRVPVDDNAMAGPQPTYRDLWSRVREELPKRGRKGNDAPKLPAELQGALNSLYGNYERYFQQWQKTPHGRTPPVMIIVCNNTAVSKLVYDWVAGHEKMLPDGNKVVAPGNLPIFSNEENGGWCPRPNTILVDSKQLESGEAMSSAFKRIAATEIEQFKADYQTRFPGRNVEKITDEDLLREVMNTVGKPGKLGEQIKCVVSVSMLTEGWDANTVTHILGVRAFGTQLLCEQVVGRGLRRTSYETERLGTNTELAAFPPEYAEVYGIPFSFIPSAGTSKIQPPRKYTHVRALEDRINCEIIFPRVVGYRYQFEADKIDAEFGPGSHYALSTEETPTKTKTASIIGEDTGEDTSDYLTYHEHRIQEVEYELTKTTLQTYFREDEHRQEGEVKWYLFPQLLEIVRHWMKNCLHCKDNTYPQMLLIDEYRHSAAHRIYQAVIKAERTKPEMLLPILRPHDSVGSTRHVAFDTARPVYPTAPKKCHISHVVADTDSWEQKTAQALEEMDEVVHYVKNHNLGFTIPYIAHDGTKQYIPDFIAKVNIGDDEPLNLILEVSGRATEDKTVKGNTTKNLWVPAVSKSPDFGRWEFLEVSDPWDVQNTILAFLNQLNPASFKSRERPRLDDVLSIYPWVRHFSAEECDEFLDELSNATDVDEVLDAWRETAEILADPETMADIAESEKQIADGEGVSWHKVKQRLNISSS